MKKIILVAIIFVICIACTSGKVEYLYDPPPSNHKYVNVPYTERYDSIKNWLYVTRYDTLFISDKSGYTLYQINNARYTDTNYIYFNCMYESFPKFKHNGQIDLEIQEGGEFNYKTHTNFGVFKLFIFKVKKSSDYFYLRIKDKKYKIKVDSRYDIAFWGINEHDVFNVKYYTEFPLIR